MLSSWRMYEMHLALFLKAGCDNKSQWGAIPKYPSHTATKMAACEMELGLRLCNSTP
jgi:hypothetical protein